MKWCLLYHLPHPQELLFSPTQKLSFKRMVKKSIINYWEILLRAEASSKSSLQFFNPSYMSIASPHPVLTTAGSYPSKKAMTTVQAVMMSGRYRTDALCSHWFKNKSGLCLLFDQCVNMVEDINHILRICKTTWKLRQK